MDFGGQATSTRTIGNLENVELEHMILTNLTQTICEAVKREVVFLMTLFSFVYSSSHDPTPTNVSHGDVEYW